MMNSMSNYQKDERVDDYIASLPEWQQIICQKVRDIVHAADPKVAETIKRSIRPYFVLNGNICALLAAKDHLNIFIYDPEVPDPSRIINQGQNNITAQAVQVKEGESINEAALLSMFKEVVVRNKAGGWRKLRN